MKWFEEHIERRIDADEVNLRGESHEDIAGIANSALDADTMAYFVSEFFFSQKGFSKFLGVGESTVAGWMKSRKFPAYAKRAALAAYLARKNWRDLAKARKDANRPKVVKDGERYLVVIFKKDEVGVSIGKILARDIPSEAAALLFVSGPRAWELLGDAMHLIDSEIEVREEEDSDWIVELKETIETERARAIAHEKLLEVERLKREDREKLYAEWAAKHEGMSTEEILMDLGVGKNAASASTEPADEEEEK